MPSERDIAFVVAIYVHENRLHPSMSNYIKIVLERGKSPKQLHAMTKEEVWGLVAYFAKGLQEEMARLGGLNL
jgi:hypothetical protein